MTAADSEIAGYPMKLLREFLRAAPSALRNDGQFSYPILEGIAKDHGIQLNTLIQHGLFERISDNECKITQAGVKIAVVKFQKRMTRPQLEALLQDVLLKVQEVNTEDRFVSAFEMLGVFGSYLRDEPDYGDLDIIYRLNYKKRWLDDWHSKNHFETMTDFHLEHFPADHHRGFLGGHYPGIDDRPVMHVKARRGRVHMVSEWEFALLERKSNPIAYRILVGQRTDGRC